LQISVAKPREKKIQEESNQCYFEIDIIQQALAGKHELKQHRRHPKVQPPAALASHKPTAGLRLQQSWLQAAAYARH
jgi:hypothetical protein